MLNITVYYHINLLNGIKELHNMLNEPMPEAS